MKLSILGLKSLFLLWLIVGFYTVSFSQNPTYKASAPKAERAVSSALSKGDGILSAGVGMGYNYFSLYNVGFSPLMQVSYDHAIAPIGPAMLTIGGLTGVGLSSARYRNFFINEWNEYRFRWVTVPVVAKAEVHYNFNEPKLDTWAGLMAGLQFVSASTTRVSGSDRYNGNLYSGVGEVMGLYVGGAYYFENAWFLWGRMGYGVSWFTVGAGYRL